MAIKALVNSGIVSRLDTHSNQLYDLSSSYVTSVINHRLYGVGEKAVFLSILVRLTEKLAGSSWLLADTSVKYFWY